MDNLALNIFVPEERKSKPSKTQKPKKSPVGISRGDKSHGKKLGKRPAKPEVASKNSKPTFLKTKAAKSNSPNKPFLVSEKFQKSQTEKAGDDEPPAAFTVSFVKPKLFQKKDTSLKTAPKGNVNTPNSVIHDVKKDESSTGLDERRIENDNTEGENKKLSPSSQNIVDFTGSSKSRGKKKFKRGETDVFAPRTFSKWSINTDGGSKKVQVDFSKGVGSQTAAPKKFVKRKFDFEGEEAVGNGKEIVDDDESEPRAKIRKKKVVADKTGKCPPLNGGVECEDQTGRLGHVKSGPISSLFDGEPSVEKIDDFDVKPVEERLFSTKQFSDVGVHPHLVGNLQQLFGITKMTVVQKKTIPVLMSGKDGLVRSQTGSGKTLAYAIPIMHHLAGIRPQLTRKDGVKALVVLPTRELALQTYECFMKLMRAFTWIVPGIVVGGEKRKSEKTRLRKGITVLIGTLGRLLDHAEHTDSLSLHGIDWLIIDEADKLLEMGYEKDISALMGIVNGQREKSENPGRKQTVLLSATLTSGVERLANLALTDPVRVDACGEAVMEDVLVIPHTLQQNYVVVPAKMRLVALASFLIDVAKLKASNKILVFMATQDMVDFYLELLQGVLSSFVKFYKLHGNMSQTDRTEVFNRFRASEKGVLLSTDVAARGLDLPKVDWILQYTAPTTPAEYVHRVGRTARVGTSGSALLFLLPSELHFVSMLNSSRIKLAEVSMDRYLKSLMKINLESKDGQRWGGGVEGAATVLQHNFEHSILEDSDLHELAAKAYKSWVRFYATYPKDLRVVFDFKSLHLGHNAKSFALRDPPKAIGGIGKPKKGDNRSRKEGNPRGTDRKRRKPEGLGHVTSGSRTKKLIWSEFDSGLKPVRKS